MITCPISTGELLDKISILQIKLQNISDTIKLQFVQKELNLLLSILVQNQLSDLLNHDLFTKLKFYNTKLWDIEDNIREKERRKEFDHEFIKIARSVYHNNDKRAEIKRAINLECKSEIVEVKSYEAY